MKIKLLLILCAWGFIVGWPVSSYAQQKPEAQVDLIICPGLPLESHSLYDWQGLRNQIRPETKGRNAPQIVTDAIAELALILPFFKDSLQSEYEKLFDPKHLKDHRGVDFSPIRSSISACPLRPVLIWREPAVTGDAAVHRDADRWDTLDEMTKASLSLELVLQKLMQLRDHNQLMAARYLVGLLLSGQINQLKHKSLIELQIQTTLRRLHVPFIMANKVHQIEVVNLEGKYLPSAFYESSGELNQLFIVGFGLHRVKIGDLQFDCKGTEVNELLLASLLTTEGYLKISGGPNSQSTACQLSKPMQGIQSFGHPAVIRNGQLCSVALRETNGLVREGCFQVEGL